MTISARFLLKGTLWTGAAFGLALLLRFVTNIILARLLAPQLFGIMLLVNSFKTGIELISDVGVGQNIIYHQNANDQEFYNTAWTLQAIRGLVLWLLAFILAAPFAHFYESPILLYVVPLTAFNFVLSGFSSVSISLLLKRLQIARYSMFEVVVAFVSSAAFVLFAYFWPTIWALVYGGLFGSAVPMIGSYFLLPDIKQRVYLSKRFAVQILHFGKWVFASSIVYFLSTNFDRLYLAKVIPLDLLGVYGIARSMSELVGLLTLRFGNIVIFPLISSHAQMARSELRKQLFSIRLIFLLLTGVCFSLIATTADLLIRLLYDERYQAAVWMLPLLIIGSWFSVLAFVNESTLLGLGKPSYGAISNASKFTFLVIALPLGVAGFGLLGGILVIAFCDLVRYFPLLIGQKREHFSFGLQDALVTVAVFLLIWLWQWLRFISGFGTSFDSLPIDVDSFFAAVR